MVELMKITNVYKEYKEIEFYETSDETRHCYRFRFPKARNVDKTMQKTIVALDSDFYNELPWETLDRKVFDRLKKAANKLTSTYESRLAIGTTIIDTTHYI